MYKKTQPYFGFSSLLLFHVHGSKPRRQSAALLVILQCAGTPYDHGL